jgi:AhpD family alkylhydroperoxidase
MQPRLNFSEVSPDALKAMLNLEACSARGSIERPLIELVKMRVSQINGCAYCLDMHSKDARAAGGERAAPLLPRCLARDPRFIRRASGRRWRGRRRSRASPRPMCRMRSTKRRAVSSRSRNSSI